MTHALIADSVAAVLAEFANQIEVPEVAFDQGGYARFQVDDDLEILFAGDATGLTLSMGIGLLPAGHALERKALEASFWSHESGHSWFGLHPQTGLLHVFRRLVAQGLDFPAFEAALRQLLEDGVQWRSALQEPQAGANSSLMLAHGFDRA